jgi:hypothetical protein
MGCLRENENSDNDRDRRIYRNRDEQAVKKIELGKREKRTNDTEYVNRNGPKDAHKDKGLIVGTDNSEEKCPDCEKKTVNGRRPGIGE